MATKRPARKWRWKTAAEAQVERDRADKEERFNYVYCTTFCNQGHRVGDGLPVDHECYILNAAQLRNEAYGDEIDFSVSFRTDKIHRGIPYSETEIRTPILPDKISLESP